MNAFTEQKVSRVSAPDATPEGSDDLVVTIVMPCLNEAESLAPCIEMAHEGLRIAGVKGEILIADNGSTDGSQELAESLGARVAHIEARGYGSALQGGIAAARGKYVLMGDADGSYDFRHLNRFLERLDEGYDLVMGNRFAGGIAKGAMPPLHQYFGNPGLSWLGRLFFRSQGGRLLLRPAGVPSRRRCRSSSCRARVWSSGSRWWPRPPCTTCGSPRCPRRCRPICAPALRTCAPGATAGARCASSCSTALAGCSSIPACCSCLLGLVLGIALLPGPLVIGSARLDVHTMLYAGVAVVVGFQAVVFSVLARVYAGVRGLPARQPSRAAGARPVLTRGRAAGRRAARARRDRALDHRLRAVGQLVLSSTSTIPTRCA